MKNIIIVILLSLFSCTKEKQVEPTSKETILKEIRYSVSYIWTGSGTYDIDFKDGNTWTKYKGTQGYMYSTKFSLGDTIAFRTYKDNINELNIQVSKSETNYHVRNQDTFAISGTGEYLIFKTVKNPKINEEIKEVIWR